VGLDLEGLAGARGTDLAKRRQPYCSSKSKIGCWALQRTDDLAASTMAKQARRAAQAATEGEAVRQLALCSNYLDGNGMPQDKAKAAQLFRRAADQGLAAAQCARWLLPHGRWRAAGQGAGGAAV
jgi:TPR repeat protein